VYLDIEVQFFFLSLSLQVVEWRRLNCIKKWMV